MIKENFLITLHNIFNSGCANLYICGFRYDCLKCKDFTYDDFMYDHCFNVNHFIKKVNFTLIFDNGVIL